RGGVGRRPRLGQRLGRRGLRYRVRYLVYEERSGEDQDAVGRYQPIEPLHGLLQQGAVPGQRQELLGALGSRERPEPGPGPAREDRGPDAHRGSSRAGGGPPSSMAALRAVSLLGLNGLVRSAAPSSSTSPSTRSSPSAVSTMTGRRRVAAAARSSRNRSRPEPSGRWRASSMASRGAWRSSSAARASASVRARPPRQPSRSRRA